MQFFSSPRSYRLTSMEPSPEILTSIMDPSNMGIFNSSGRHSQHPDFAHLTLLVFEAVLEVVCVSLPGYIVARQGMFDAEAQKFVANLNVQLFTPCLIFYKLASKLTADSLLDLSIIPLIFIVQTLVSYMGARIVCRLFSFKERATNFVIAMAVFGNSNSLPISLVISLSSTLKGLHWDKIPGDNDEEVGARGILYLLIFQQLGQLLRWSWGYNVLLKPASAYPEENDEETQDYLNMRYSDTEGRLIPIDEDEDSTPSRSDSSQDLSATAASYSEFESGTGGTATPYDLTNSSSTAASSTAPSIHNGEIMPTPTNGNSALKGPGNMAGHGRQYSTGYMTSFPASGNRDFEEIPQGPKGWWIHTKRSTRQALSSTGQAISRASSTAFGSLPLPVQKVLSTIWGYIAGFFLGLWSFMNPPLWAMLAAIIVASVPALQHAFFTKGTFIENSVTRAIGQSGGVAVPLILVVLGANLARNTLPKDQQSAEDPKLERKLLIASLVCRMLLPTLIMAPMLALVAKYIPVSIVDDKIFIIVCFLLTGAPSALQLAQICQINNVYMGAMTRLLFQSYVVWILPSTLILVMLALETVEWATLGR